MLIFFVASWLLCVAADPIGIFVNTTYGPIKGAINEADQILFLGIPYAKPPISTLRWTAPQQPTAWTEIRNTTKFGYSCIQDPNGVTPVHSVSEDCLVLNVWVPKGASTDNLLPVLFWIHGGAFVAGSSSDYDGTQIVKNNNVVFVSINYRLNYFGFFINPELLKESSATNFGLLDQQFALKWVSENIKQFGGDPSNVLIYGESAGGGSVAFHLSMESSYPFYSHAMLESLGPAFYPNLTTQVELGKEITHQSPCAEFPENEILPCLRELPAELVYQQWSSYNTVQPLIDGKLVKELPVQAAHNGNINTKVPVIIGSNWNEGILFTSINQLDIGSKLKQTLTQSEFDAILYRSNLDLWVPVDQLKQFYPANNDQQRWEQMNRILGDGYIDCGTYLFAEGLYKYSESNVWRYLFTHNTTDKSNLFSQFGASHGAEVVYVFEDPAGFGIKFTKEEYALSFDIMDFIKNFHNCGNPNGCGEETRQSEVSWPIFEGAESNTTFVWNTAFGLVENWRVEACTRLAPYLLAPNNNVL